ncbi:chromate efflux transporter [Rugamonas sp. CCM 8940]|uniref:chromate efflux transporter n=1 Tax=Rugamonas sp. CCM 8940 TaxID=2765359 RepID=UPI0018F2C384|nr:chromate efflux transporter [Rugamonas sp. CCM 8940]MBJ7312963.1 chromate efflux transporter [Rugamonas sp. CCM 8940]
MGISEELRLAPPAAPEQRPELPGKPGAAPLPPVSLRTLALLFLRIGCSSVGGFMAMVAVTQQMVVDKRRLLPAEDLLDGLALASVMPGPVAINVVAYVGYRLRGVAGAIVCMLCAVLPAFVWVTTLGLLYFRYGSMDAVRTVFLGVTPAITAVVLASACRLWRGAVRDGRQAALALGAAALLTALPGLPSTLLVLLVAAWTGWKYPRPGTPNNADAAGLAGRGMATPAAGATPTVHLASLDSGARIGHHRRARRPARHHAALLAALGLPAAALALLAANNAILFTLLCSFAGMSLLTFGGGYVFIPLLQHTVVDGYGWLSQREFIDGIALTQLSPGPVMISSAFVGLKVAGLAGAAAASAGMFVPSAALMLAASGMVERLRHSAPAQAALAGVRAALAGMVFGAAVTIGRMAAPNWLSLALCAAALLALLRWRVDAAWVVAAAALIGWLAF